MDTLHISLRSRFETNDRVFFPDAGDTGGKTFDCGLIYSRVDRKAAVWRDDVFSDSRGNLRSSDIRRDSLLFPFFLYIYVKRAVSVSSLKIFPSMRRHFLTSPETNEIFMAGWRGRKEGKRTCKRTRKEARNFPTFSRWYYPLKYTYYL